MSRPGEGLRRLAARVCSERTRRRLIEPAVADLQSEFSVARRDGSRWRTLRTLGAGYLSIAKVLVIAACGDLRRQAFTWRPEERAGAWRGVLVAIVTTAAPTALLVAKPLGDLGITTDWTLMGAYLLPSTLAMTAPLGLALGTAWMLHGAARTRKLGVAAIVIATLCSIGMFVNVGWLTPEANQAFRERAFVRQGGSPTAVVRGLNELTLPALRAQLEQDRAFGPPHRARYSAAVYYRKFAITLAPLPMIGVVLGLAFRRRLNRSRLVAGTTGMCVGHVVVLMWSFYVGAVLGLPPIVIGWSATAACAAAALLIISSPSRA